VGSGWGVRFYDEEMDFIIRNVGIRGGLADPILRMMLVYRIYQEFFSGRFFLKKVLLFSTRKLSGIPALQ
jgi:hypothetical protein